MRLTADEVAQLDHLLEPYFDHDKVQLMRTFAQHGAGWSHSYLHPLRSIENARKYFGVSERMSQAIESHMLPWPPTRPPRRREGAITWVANKICTLLETAPCWTESTSICH